MRQAQLLLNVQRQAEAQKYLNTYLEKHPDDPQAIYLLAKAYEAQEQYGKANEQLLKSFNSPELDIQMKIQEMAKLIGQLPDPALEKSLPQLAMAIQEAHPEDAQAYAIHGDYLIAVNQKAAARSQYLKALALDESNFSVWQNVLSLGLELGRYDSVAREAEEALALFPNQSAIYYFSGSAHLSLNQF
ncbi:MAG: tetratricopeptide repeat protein, partial [Bacteroidetes bacterium]|nr:tetratricopeptide repeat protein [Bacteroidota bacterium]